MIAQRKRDQTPLAGLQVTVPYIAANTKQEEQAVLEIHRCLNPGSLLESKQEKSCLSWRHSSGLRFHEHQTPAPNPAAFFLCS